MSPSEQPAASALQTLLQDGSLAGTWTLDPARSEVVLHTRHTWGLLPLRGVFGQISGRGTVTKDGDASCVITVAAESVDTKNPRRDKHLRSADFFDVANHPAFTFAAVVHGSSVRQLPIEQRPKPLRFHWAVQVQRRGASTPPCACRLPIIGVVVVAVLVVRSRRRARGHFGKGQHAASST